MENIFNGVIRAKITYNVESHNSILNVIGLNKIQRALIQLVGHPPRCLFCEKFGHIVSNCPLAETICKTCNKRGHNAENCNLANQLMAKLKEKIDESLEISSEFIEEKSENTCQVEICIPKHDNREELNIPTEESMKSELNSEVSKTAMSEAQKRGPTDSLLSNTSPNHQLKKKNKKTSSPNLSDESSENCSAYAAQLEEYFILKDN